MDERTQSGAETILFFVILEKEVADRVCLRVPKFVIDQRFRQDRFSAPWICRYP
jgi:hypothetical protein